MSWRSNPNPTIKPPFGSIIDPGHPLANGLAECILFNEHSGGTINNLVSHKNFTVYQGTPYWDGKGFYLDDHGNGVDNDIINAPFGCIRTDITTTAIELVDSDLGLSQNTFFRGGNTHEIASIKDSGDIYYTFKDSASHGFEGTISVNYQANKRVQIGFIADWKNNLGYSIYNSQKIGLTQAGDGWRSSSPFGTTIQVGYGSNYNDYYGLNGHIYLFYLFLREFSVEELEWILAEPYCFIAWPSHRVIFDYGAGGATLSVSGLGHIQGLDQPSLTQKHNLVIQELLHSHSIDNVDLITAIELIVQSLDHAQNLDQLLLTQKHVLSLNELTHNHGIKSPVLTQAHFLILGDLAHAQSIESPILSQKHNLLINELLHAQEIDQPTLSQKHALIVAALSHAQTIDNVTLSLSTLLEVAALLHSHGLDAKSLTQKHNLTLADLLHGHEIETPLLTQAHILSIDSLGHAQIIDNIDLSTAIELIVASLLHAQGIEAPSLLQAHVLTVDELGHVQSVETPTLSQAHSLLVDHLSHGHTLDSIDFNIGKGLFTITFTPSKPGITFTPSKPTITIT